MDQKLTLERLHCLLQPHFAEVSFCSPNVFWSSWRVVERQEAWGGLFINGFKGRFIRICIEKAVYFRKLGFL